MCGITGSQCRQLLRLPLPEWVFLPGEPAALVLHQGVVLYLQSDDLPSDYLGTPRNQRAVLARGLLVLLVLADCPPGGSCSTDFMGSHWAMGFC